MKKSTLIESAKTPDGSEIGLYVRDHTYTIRVDGKELMSTRESNSEQELAEAVCKPYAGKDISVLIGGLGFGYTLKRVLETVSENSTVLVAELMPCVIAWNENPELPLAGPQLKDKRVRIRQGDVGHVIRDSQQRFDVIILDVDNGPEALTVESNQFLYSKLGLYSIKSALNPGGRLGIWSIDGDKRFEQLMHKGGFVVETLQARARPDKGPNRTLFIGRA